MTVGPATVLGGILTALAGACVAGALRLGGDDPDGAVYLLGEAAALLIAALSAFGVFG
jgi:hypothetical protein